MSVRADSADYLSYARTGTATINGQSFLTTRGGDVKLGAGRTVTLDPATKYALEWHAQTSTALDRLDIVPPDSLFRRFRRVATVDAQGHFRFANLPAGSYIIRSSVTWETGSSYDGLQGGIVADVVTIADGEQHDLILNRVATSTALGLPSIPILTAEQIGGRSFSTIRQVTGSNCQRAALTDPAPTESAARADLAMQSGKLGADAVTNVVCKAGGLSFRRNCFSFIECVGDAIRWLS